MSHVLKMPFLAAAILATMLLPDQAGAASESSAPMTVIVFKGERPVPPAAGTPLVPVAGAECPTGSGAYCSDELPYCCPGVSVDPYCAKNVKGCTK